MISQDLKKYKLPDKPGVYRFLLGQKILYIGKATSLKDRVRSYFAGDLGETRGPKISQMLAVANKIDWQETDSVLEALLLETALIKKHQPKYNSREKDDKSYWFVVMTKEDFPRVLMVRGRQLFDTHTTYNILNTKYYSFGPFPYASELKEALKIIRKIFPYRDKCQPLGILPSGKIPSGHPCFNYQIGLCPGVCVGKISRADYRRTIKNLKLFFSGQKKRVIENLKKEMKLLARAQKFEEAGKIRNQIFALNHIQDISLLKQKSVFLAENFSVDNSRQKNREIFRIEAYDIAHLSGTGTVGALAVWQNDELAKTEYRRFKIHGVGATKVNDTANLEEILRRRFAHQEWPWPDFIVVDGGLAQINIARKVLTDLNLKIPILAVLKDQRHQPQKIIGDKKITAKYKAEIIAVNHEAHRLAVGYHRKIRRLVVK